MKNNLLLFLTTLVVVALSSCGGSGGGGSDNSNPEPVNNPPVISATAPDIARAGQDFLFTPTWSDPDGDRPLFTIENQPDWTTFDPNTGGLSGVPTDEDVEIYDDIVITISDGEFQDSSEPFSLTVLFGLINRESITNSPEAIVTETMNGFEVVGDTLVEVGGFATAFVDANLQFEFDAEGNLIDVFGESDLPPEISENLSINGSVRTFLKMYTGAEINADPDIGPESNGGILLRDDFRYIVFSLTTGIDVAVNTDGDEEEELEFGGTVFETLILSDLTDPFFYIYGDAAGVGGLGFGYSLRKNIPFQPNFVPDNTINIDVLESFDDGQMVLRGRHPFGGGPLFSAFEFEGVAVCRPPQLLGCTKPNLKTFSGIALVLGGALIGIAGEGGINETQQFKVGMNGTTAFDLTVLGFIELFRYELFDMSATLDIGTDFQQLAMLGVVDAEESDQPDWIPFSVASDDVVVASLFFNIDTDYNYDPLSTTIGNTGRFGLDVEVTGADFGLAMYGEFDSDFPEARIIGETLVDPSGMTLVGIVDDGENPLTVSATVDADGLEAFVDLSYDIAGNINTVVNDGFDSALEALNEALMELEDAVAEYDGAVSLDGFRSQIPNIIDNTIIPALNGVPQRVYDRVYDITYDGITNDAYCFTVIITACADDILNADDEAEASATTTRNNAQADVAALIVDLEELRVEAERAEDTPAFRSALKDALNRAVSMYTYSQSVLIRRTINYPSPIPDRTITFFDGNVVISPTYGANTRDDLVLAANNVDDIGPAQTVVIDTQQYVNSLPGEQAIEDARAEVENGLRVIPSFDGLGYTFGSDFSQSVFVVLSGERTEAEFNPLDPVSVVANIGKLIANSLIED